MLTKYTAKYICVLKRIIEMKSLKKVLHEIRDRRWAFQLLDFP